MSHRAHAFSLALSLVCLAQIYAGEPLLAVTEVASGLQRPVGAVFAPGDTSRMFVLEQGGNLRVVRDGNLLAEPFLTVATSTESERGLLGVVFHPDYQTNRFLFVNYTRIGDGATIVMRYQRQAGNPDRADMNSGVTILTQSQPQANHNGGWMGFNPLDLGNADRRHWMYIAFGDGGNGNDEGPDHTNIGNGQSTGTLLGKIVRIDVDPAEFGGAGQQPYGIPSANRLLASTAAIDGRNLPPRPEIWAMGVRNPWRCSFDRQTGDLYIGDVGDGGAGVANEEISVAPYNSSGLNFGWRAREADQVNDPRITPVEPLTGPILTLPQGAVIGGYVYRGSAIPGLMGTYVFADYRAPQVITVVPNVAATTSSNLRTDRRVEIDQALGRQLGAISSWGEDNAGELYLCEYNAGRVYRLRSQSVSQTPPSFTTTAPLVATVGSAYRYRPTVTGSPTPTVSLTAGPAGMTFNAGTLEWSNPSIGTHTVILRATNGQAPDAVQSFVLVVESVRAGDPVPATDLENGVLVSRFIGNFASVSGMDGQAARDSVPADAIGILGTLAPQADAYGLRFTGFFEITLAGTYRFALTSDDGSRLRIGERTVIDNDGPHGVATVRGEISLAAGRHRFTVDYFDIAGAGDIVDLTWAPPGQPDYGPIPTGNLKRWVVAPGVDVWARGRAYLNMPTVITGALPATLSATGAFSDTARLIPSAGVVPYDVNSPLWSDAADKRRWLMIPDGTTATLSALGNWTFPAGTVFVKHFEYPGRRLETRLLVMQPLGEAYGVTYRWNADQTDANLLTGSLTETVSTTSGPRSWTYPSRVDCMSCHTQVSGRALGVRTNQLAGTQTYSSTGRIADRLRTLHQLGQITGWSAAAAPGYTRLANIADLTQPIEHRVRSYLDANCMSCHQPGGPTPVGMDLRYSTPLAEAGVINAATINALGLANAGIITPGMPDSSTLLARLVSTDPAVRMPPLGRAVHDTAATTVIRQWITGLGSGPVVAPTITAQPTSRSVVAGTSTTLSVTAAGTGLSYQWRRGGANISGATSTSYTLTPVVGDSGAVFSVVVSNSAGSVTSAGATLTVTTSGQTWSVVRAIDSGKVTGTPITAGGILWTLDTTMAADRVEGPTDFAGTTTLDAVHQTNQSAPAFTYRFSNLTVGSTYRARVLTTEVWFTAVGNRVFSVTANGTSVASNIDPFLLGGARFTASEVQTSTFQPNDSGWVDLSFVASLDQALVSGLVLEVLGGGVVVAAPTITTQPTSRSMVAGISTTLSVTATGTGLSYQWLRGGSTIAGATSSSYTLTPVVGDSGAVFSVRVSNSAGSVTSAGATLTVTTSGQTWSVVRAIDSGKVTGTPITAEGILWTLDATMAADRVEGPTDFAGTTTLDAVHQTNQSAPAFTYRFTNLTVGSTYRARVLTTEVYFTASGSRVFSVTANGTTVASNIDPFLLGGARFTASEVQTSTFRPTASGSVDLSFVASRDQALVSGLVLEVLGGGVVVAAPTITTQPTSRSVVAGISTTLSVTATGTGLSYQWRRGGANIVGATSSSYTLTPVVGDNGAVLSVVVSNSAGSVTSASATLTVTSSNSAVIRINFQPAASAVPAGFLRDTGAVFGPQNGYSYGWNIDSTTQTLDRNLNPNEVFGTLIHLSLGGSPIRSWSIGLVNGIYDLDIFAGDPSYNDSMNSFTVEGVPVIDPTPMTSFNDRYNQRVTVSDGRLNVEQSPIGVNAKLQAIVITPVPAGGG